MGLYATDMHLIRKLWKRNQKIKNLLISRLVEAQTNKETNKQERNWNQKNSLISGLVKALARKIKQTNKQTNKRINNSLISGLVKALVQAPSQVNVPQGAGEVGADYRLPVTLERHCFLVIPETPLQSWDIFLVVREGRNKHVPVFSSIEVAQLSSISACLSFQALWLSAFYAHLHKFFCQDFCSKLVKGCWPSGRSCGRARWRGRREESRCRRSWERTLAEQNCGGSSWRRDDERIWTCELVELVGLGQGASIEVTATGNRGYLHLWQRKEHRACNWSVYKFKQVSQKDKTVQLQRSKTVLIKLCDRYWTCIANKQTNKQEQGWNIEPALES